MRHGRREAPAGVREKFGSFCFAALLGFPRIEQRNACRFEVCDIASDDRETVNYRCCRDQGIAFCARVGNMKTRATLRHGSIDRQDTAFEARQNLFIDPSAQDGAVCRVLSCAQKRAELDFQNRDHRQEYA